MTLLNITLSNRRRNRVENEDNRKNRNVSMRYTLLGENVWGHGPPQNYEI